MEHILQTSGDNLDTHLFDGENPDKGGIDWMIEVRISLQSVFDTTADRNLSLMTSGRTGRGFNSTIARCWEIEIGIDWGAWLLEKKGQKKQP